MYRALRPSPANVASPTGTAGDDRSILLHRLDEPTRLKSECLPLLYVKPKQKGHHPVASFVKLATE